MPRLLPLALVSGLLLLPGLASAAETLQIRLQGNPTTGYEWTLLRMTPEGVVACSSPDYLPDRPPTGSSALSGAGGEYVFTLHALQPGEAELAFHYARSWEKGEGAEFRNVKVRVDSARNITLMEPHS